MTTIKFYGRPLPADHRNIKLLMLGFYLALMALSYVVLGLNACALARLTGLSMWVTLPLLIAFCLSFEANGREWCLLPEKARRYLQQALTPVSLYVFWEGGNITQFAIVAVFVTHVVTHKLSTRYWEQKEKSEAERTKIAQGLTDVGYGQRSSNEDAKS